MTVRGCTCGAAPFGLHAQDCPEWQPIAIDSGIEWTPTHVALVDKPSNQECRIIPDDVQ